MACVSFLRGPTSSMSAASRRGPARGRSMPTKSCSASCPWSRAWPSAESWCRSTPAVPPWRAPASMPAHASSTTSRRCRTIPALMPLIAERGAPVVLMHRQGRPEEKYVGAGLRQRRRRGAPVPGAARRGLPGRRDRARAHRPRSRPGLRQERAGERRSGRRSGPPGRGRLSRADRRLAQELHRPADRHRGAAPARSGLDLARRRGRPAWCRLCAGPRRRRHATGPRSVAR